MNRLLDPPQLTLTQRDLQLPDTLDRIIGAFPLKALADGLRSAYDPAAQALPVGDIAVLLIWTIAGITLATRFFRWNP